MRNLKKTLAVVLAFAMVFSMGIINTFAFSDVEAGTVVDEAVGILSNLGILEGFEDGTFKPEESVTRAQMAAIICRTLGYEAQAQSSKGVTMFNDVAADHWASGYINVAQAQQIINGYGDGNFGPEDKVTYEQAVKMIVAALNYDLVAQAKGGYPTGYLAVASAEGITKSANGRVGDAAKRATVATLVYNSLEVRLMDQKSWSTGTSGNEFGKTNDTILSKYLNVEKWEGIVSATPIAYYAQNGYTADAEVELGLTGAKKIAYNAYGELVATEAEFEDVDCSLVDVNTLAGKKVVAYVGEDEDAETGNRMVYAIAEKKGANKTVTINANQLITEDYSDFEVRGQVSYKNAGSNKVYDLELADNAEYSVNFDEAKAVKFDHDENDETEKVLLNTAEFAELVADGGVLTFISNDNDADYEVVQITAYTGEAVIEEVEEEDGIISFECYTGSIEDVDTEEEDLLVVVYKDGALADVKALAANDTVSKIEIDDSFVVLYASSKTVTGKVESYSSVDGYVTIAGTDYTISSLSSETVSTLKDKEGVFFLNVDGQIAYADAEATKGNYGLVLSAYYSEANDEYTANVMLADGTVATYTIYAKATITIGEETSEKGDDVVYNALATIIPGTGARQKATVATAKDLLFEVTIKNGEITKLVNVAESARKTGKKYDAENNSYGALEFDDSTVVFAVAQAYNADDELTAADVKVGKIADYFVDGEGEGFNFYAYDDEDVVGAIMGFEFATAIDAESDAVIVTGNKTIIYGDEEAAKITGIQGGEKVTYILYNEDEVDFGADLVAGDVIMVAAADADGVVADYEVLFDGEVQADDDEDTFYLFGDLESATNTKFFFVEDGLYTDDYVYSAEDGIALKDSANYTLVDYTESATPEISKKSKGKSIFGSARHTSKVFVRIYDDKLVEVVVYRELAPEA